MSAYDAGTTPFPPTTVDITFVPQPAEAPEAVVRDLLIDGSGDPVIVDGIVESTPGIGGPIDETDIGELATAFIDADVIIATNGSAQDVAGLEVTFATGDRAANLSLKIRLSHAVAQPAVGGAAVALFDENNVQLDGAGVDCTVVDKVQSVWLHAKIPPNTPSHTYRAIVYAPNNGDLTVSAAVTAKGRIQALQV